MILMKDIIREGNPLLREKSTEVNLPLSKEDEDILISMIEYIDNSIDEEIATKYDLRAAVGIAAPQIGILKKMFVIYLIDELDTTVEKIKLDELKLLDAYFNFSSSLIPLKPSSGFLYKTFSGTPITSPILITSSTVNSIIILPTPITLPYFHR